MGLASEDVHHTAFEREPQLSEQQAYLVSVVTWATIANRFHLSPAELGVAAAVATAPSSRATLRASSSIIGFANGYSTLMTRAYPGASRCTETVAGTFVNDSTRLIAHRHASTGVVMSAVALAAITSSAPASINPSAAALPRRTLSPPS